MENRPTEQFTTSPQQNTDNIYPQNAVNNAPPTYGYSVGQPAAAHNYSTQRQFFVSPQQEALYYEKNAVKKVSNRIGMGLLLSVIIGTVLQLVLSFILIFTGNEEILESSAVLLVLNMVLTFLSFPVAAYFITSGTKLHQIISFGAPKKDRLISCIMIGISFCYVANVAVSILQTRFSEILPFAQSEIGSPKGVWGIALSVLATAVFPAVLEEILFRGAIMGSLLKFGKPFAIFTSAFLFGIFHGNLVQIPFAFMVGLVLGFAVVETNSIWTGVIIHFINNFLAVVVDYIGVYGGENLQMAVYMILMAAILMVGFFGVYLLSLKNKELFKYKKTPHISTSKTRFGWHCSSATVVVYFVIVGLEVLMLQLSA